MGKIKEDMTGWKMWEHGVLESKLTVIRRAEEDGVDSRGFHYPMWLCECNCEEHNQIRVSRTNLIKGYVKSCGCMPKGRKVGGSNEYEKRCDESGEYYVGFTSNTGKEFYFDVEDYEKVKQYNWGENGSNENYRYVIAWDRELKKYIKLHWLIAGKYYDHIDRNPFNNRRLNLRKATHRENLRNQSKSTRNTSGVIGVGWYSRYNKWVAYICTDVRRTLGYFNTKEEAIKARLNAEMEYFGEFAPQKHLYKQYGIESEKDYCEEVNDEMVKT